MHRKCTTLIALAVATALLATPASADFFKDIKKGIEKAGKEVGKAASRVTKETTKTVGKTLGGDVGKVIEKTGKEAGNAVEDVSEATASVAGEIVVEGTKIAVTKAPQVLGLVAASSKTSTQNSEESDDSESEEDDDEAEESVEEAVEDALEDVFNPWDRAPRGDLKVYSPTGDWASDTKDSVSASVTTRTEGDKTIYRVEHRDAQGNVLRSAEWEAGRYSPDSEAAPVSFGSGVVDRPATPGEIEMMERELEETRPYLPKDDDEAEIPLPEKKPVGGPGKSG